MRRYCDERVAARRISATLLTDGYTEHHNETIYKEMAELRLAPGDDSGGSTARLGRHHARRLHLHGGALARAGPDQQLRDDANCARRETKRFGTAEQEEDEPRGHRRRRGSRRSR